jgi:hypothetical protein
MFSLKLEGIIRETARGCIHGIPRANSSFSESLSATGEVYNCSVWRQEKLLNTYRLGALFQVQD